jgi:hypothetical protein
MQASTDREACAEVAPPAPNEPAQPGSSSDHDTVENGTLLRDIPPGEYPLPADVEEFVQEIHRKVDITEVWHGLLRNPDDKIRQRAVEKLTEMRYKGASALADESSQVVVDIDSAVARRAAEGAKK